jgi:hypothetical protein
VWASLNFKLTPMMFNNADLWYETRRRMYVPSRSCTDCYVTGRKWRWCRTGTVVGWDRFHEKVLLKKLLTLARIEVIYVMVKTAKRDGTVHPHRRDNQTADEYNWQAMPRLRWIFAEPSPRRSGFNPGQFRWDLLTTKWQLRHIFLQVLRVPRASIIPLMHHIHRLIHHRYY